MKRGELYRVRHPSRRDPKRFRVFVVVSLPKSALTDYVGSLSPQKVAALNRALRVALDLPD